MNGPIPYTAWLAKWGFCDNPQNRYAYECYREACNPSCYATNTPPNCIGKVASYALLADVFGVDVLEVDAQLVARGLV